jgi:PAS domain S-box-containing protein
MSEREATVKRVAVVNDRPGRAAARRRATEEALRVSEERLRLALEATSEAVWDWNVVEGSIYQSPAWARMLGYPLEATPATWAQLAPYFHPDDLPMMQREIGRALAGTSDSFSFEHRARAASGEWRWLLARARVVERNARGEGVRVVGVCADISAQKAAEQALREVDAHREQFLALLSHELRNPLAAARNSLFILDQAHPGGAQARAARNILDRQLTQLTKLVEDLLDVSRISNGKVQLRRARLDLASLARRSADENRHAFAARSVDLRLELPREPVWVDCDPTRMVQVLGNLLHNAAKFTPHGHVLLAIDVEPGGRTARVRVCDTGVGIAPELLPRLFQPFQQAEDTLARSEGGLGLGLALVKDLVELHGGTVECRSGGPGAGAEFAVRLPIVPPPESAEAPCTSRPAARCLRVVAIEDDEDAAVVLGEMLEVLGHRPEVARTGAEGLALVRRVRPDVVLCDIGLPGMSGYDVARALRAEPELRDVPLVALTGYASPADVQRAAEAGFDRHLAKPIPPVELAGVLEEVVGTPREGAAALSPPPRASRP